MNSFLAFIKKYNLPNYKLPFISGVLIGTSYIPFPPWAILFGYLPLWYWLIFKAKTAKEAFWGGWVTQFTLTLIGFHWIAYTAKEFGQFPWPLAIIALLLFCALAHLYIPILTWLFAKSKEKFQWQLGTSLSFLVFGHSLAETVWPGIFPWHLGYTLLWAKLPLFHFADIFGFLGLSFILLLFHIPLGYIWFKKHELYKKIVYSSFYVLLFVGLNFAGWIYGQKWLDTDKKLNVLSVQANIGNLEKVYAEKGKFFREEIVSKFISLTEKELQANKNVDLILWPEAAIPEYLNPNYIKNKNQKRITDFLSLYSKPLLAGAFSKDDSLGDKDTSVFNGLFLLDNNGNMLSPPYHKTHLLIFGEYLPLSETFPFLLKLLPFISNFGRGQGPQILSLPMDIRKNDYALLGGQICYEGLYPDFSIGLAQKGAEIFVNVTNDSWFGIPFEPYQHLYMTFARAIENRRPLIRSTNTGISTAISAYGEVQEFSPWLKEWTGINIITYKDNPTLTFYTQWGKFFPALIFVAFMINLLLSIYYEKSRKS